MMTIFEVEAKRQKQSLHTSEVSMSQNVTIEGSIHLTWGCGSIDSDRWKICRWTGIANALEDDEHR